MKRSAALALQEGDLVDITAPDWQGGRNYDCKVLVVSSRGGVYVTGGMWDLPMDRWGNAGRWMQYHHVTATGRREELTDKERTWQHIEVERFRAARERDQQKDRELISRNKLYDFIWNELEGCDGCSLDELQAKAKLRGLRPRATTWQRAGRVLGVAGDPQFWKISPSGASTIVMPLG
jgi:hypothetical protein